MATYLIGCTHFGHKNIINLANRPFADVGEMDAKLIENWNRVVKENDNVIHLGDFVWGKPEAAATRGEALHRILNGNIMHIVGNHDHALPSNARAYMELPKQKVVLFHYPIEEWNGWYHGSYHFHCHTHKPEFQSATRRGNVSVEAIGYEPIRLEEAIELLGESG